MPQVVAHYIDRNVTTQTQISSAMKPTSSYRPNGRRCGSSPLEIRVSLIAPTRA
jgi:hypothetical protein